jgi:microcystin-dependent protein
MNQNSTLGHTVNDPGHAHSLDVSVDSGGALGTLYLGDSSGVNSDLVNSNTTGISVNAHDVSHTHTVDTPAHSGNSGSTGSGTAYFQPYLVVNYIIKHD